MPIRLIATDVDGTLLNNSGVIPERNLRAIRAAQQKGITVAISSGRFAENVYVLLEDYGLRCPIIGVNGAEVVDENLHLLKERTMTVEASRRVLDTLLRLGADHFMFASRAICTNTAQRLHHSELSYGDRIRALGFTYYHKPQDAWAIAEQGKVHKFFVCNNIPLAAVREALQGIPDIYLTHSSAYNLEVMPAGVDKGLGIRDLAEALGIPLSQVMTLGDEDNDISMLRIAGYGVAMGNGSQEAKAAARFITATNEDCGFARAIERYALA